MDIVLINPRFEVSYSGLAERQAQLVNSF